MLRNTNPFFYYGLIPISSVLLFFSVRYYYNFLNDGKTTQTIFFKSCSVLIILLIALLAPSNFLFNPLPGNVMLFLTGGLFFSLIGDIALAIPANKAKITGIISFMIVQSLYTSAFFTYTNVDDFIIPAVICVVISLFVLYRLRAMPPAVFILFLLYGIFVSVMTGTAIGGIVTGVHQRAAALFAFGAVMFFLSDILLSLYYLHVFIKKPLDKKTFRGFCIQYSTIFYFIGQYVIAVTMFYFL